MNPDRNQYCRFRLLRDFVRQASEAFKKFSRLVPLTKPIRFRESQKFETQQKDA
jgi:hypothetical protein